MFLDSRTCRSDDGDDKIIRKQASDLYQGLQEGEWDRVYSGVYDNVFVVWYFQYQKEML